MRRATRLVDYLGHIEQAAADACYWDVDLDIVWETVQSSLPHLLAQLSPVLDEAMRMAQSSPDAPKA